MIINAENQLNKKVLQYLGRDSRAERPLLASPDSVIDAYMCQGSLRAAEKDELILPESESGQKAV